MEDSFPKVDSWEQTDALLMRLARDLAVRIAEEAAENGRRARTLVLTWRPVVEGGPSGYAARRHSRSCALPDGASACWRAAAGGPGGGCAGGRPAAVEASALDRAAGALASAARGLLRAHLATPFHLTLINLAATNFSEASASQAASLFAPCPKPPAAAHSQATEPPGEPAASSGCAATGAPSGPAVAGAGSTFAPLLGKAEQRAARTGTAAAFYGRPAESAPRTGCLDPASNGHGCPGGEGAAGIDRSGSWLREIGCGGRLPFTSAHLVSNLDARGAALPGTRSPTAHAAVLGAAAGGAAEAATGQGGGAEQFWAALSSAGEEEARGRAQARLQRGSARLNGQLDALAAACPLDAVPSPSAGCAGHREAAPTSGQAPSPQPPPHPPPPARTWTCAVCTLENDKADAPVCEACQAIRPLAELEGGCSARTPPRSAKRPSLGDEGSRSFSPRKAQARSRPSLASRGRPRGAGSIEAFLTRAR